MFKRTILLCWYFFFKDNDNNKMDNIIDFFLFSHAHCSLQIYTMFSKGHFFESFNVSSYGLIAESMLSFLNLDVFSLLTLLNLDGQLRRSG